MPKSSFPREGGAGGNQGAQSLFSVSTQGDTLRRGRRVSSTPFCSLSWECRLPSCPALSNRLFLKFQILHGELKRFKHAMPGRHGWTQGRWTDYTGRGDWQDTGYWGCSKGEQSRVRLRGCHSAQWWLRRTQKPRLGSAQIFSALRHPLEAKCNMQKE